jgi:hypothetical protein
VWNWVDEQSNINNFNVALTFRQSVNNSPCVDQTRDFLQWWKNYFQKIPLFESLHVPYYEKCLLIKSD